MTIASLRARLEGGETLFGLNNMYPAAGIVEGMCKGWDLVWVDGQHGQHDYVSILNALRAAAGIGLETLVRVPSHDVGLLGRYADMQPGAIMVPMVDLPEQAASVVQGLRFPPVGNRSYGGRRPIDLHGRTYYRMEQPLVVVQIETLLAVDNAAAIAAIDGVDMLFFGPDDMKLRLGLPIDTSPFDDPKIGAALERTAAAALAAGKLAGTVAPGTRAVRSCSDLGYRLLMGGSDISFLRTLAPQRLEQMRSGLDGGTDTQVAGGVYGD